jgi:predicted metal-dependent HD superfamily phosphohydrolase
MTRLRFEAQAMGSLWFGGDVRKLMHGPAAKAATIGCRLRHVNLENKSPRSIAPDEIRKYGGAPHSAKRYPRYLPFPLFPPYSLAMTRDELIAAYTAPNRHYHNLGHIEDCLAALAGVKDISASAREILTEAIWWHDVVYDATRADNEERSAGLAEQHLRADLRDEVGRLIRLTKSHQVASDDRLGAILISIDLGILAAEPARYDAYAAAIRREYSHVPDADYRAGRARVLSQFAARPVIFPDPGFAAMCDRQARDNLARELASLR